MKIKDWISAVVRWCCQKPKKNTTAQPAQKQSYLLTAAVGSLALSGQAAALTYDAHVPTDYTLTAEAGSFSLTGKDVGLSNSTKVLGASQGSFTASGQPATLRARRFMRAVKGSVSISGQTATLKYGRKLHAINGTLSLSGKTSALSYTPVGYPESVAFKGLNAVYDLKTATVPRTPTTKTIGVDTLPDGCTDNHPSAGYLTIDTTGRTITFDNWDLTGRAIIPTGTGGSVTFTDCIVALPAGSTEFSYRSSLTFTGSATFNYCDVSAAGCGVNGGGFGPRGLDHLTLNHCNIHDIGQTPIIAESSTSASWCYFGSPGQNSSTDSHINFFQILNGGAGQFNADHCYFDLSDAMGSSGGNYTSSGFFVSCFGGDVNLTISSNIFAGIDDVVWTGTREPTRTLRFHSEPDTGTGVSDVTVSCTDNVVAPGDTAYLELLANAGSTLAYSGSGNIDFLTALPVSELNV